MNENHELLLQSESYSRSRFIASVSASKACCPALQLPVPQLDRHICHLRSSKPQPSGRGAGTEAAASKALHLHGLCAVVRLRIRVCRATAVCGHCCAIPILCAGGNHATIRSGRCRAECLAHMIVQTIMGVLLQQHNHSRGLPGSPMQQREGRPAQARAPQPAVPAVGCLRAAPGPSPCRAAHRHRRGPG